MSFFLTESIPVCFIYFRQIKNSSLFDYETGEIKNIAMILALQLSFGRWITSTQIRSRVISMIRILIPAVTGLQLNHVTAEKLTRPS